MQASNYPDGVTGSDFDEKESQEYQVTLVYETTVKATSEEDALAKSQNYPTDTFEMVDEFVD